MKTNETTYTNLIQIQIQYEHYTKTFLAQITAHGSKRGQQATQNRNPIVSLSHLTIIKRK